MQTLGKYQIVERIGVGGFGIVVKAYDPMIKRYVAIKTCTAEDAETRVRFAREAEIAGNLHHRNIVTVYEFGYNEGVPFLVQEYLSGEDLDRKIKRREFLTLPEKLLYLVQIARGLAYAHERGVIHRDIKPSNIRILEDDTAKIMDFGIAKFSRSGTSLTQTGMTLGTAAYLAPEQIRGEAVDPRTDIFSFGALAYELLSYERPFTGAEIQTVFFRVLNDNPKSLREIYTECPPELETIVVRCLEKAPAKRYATSADLLADLEDVAKRRRVADVQDTTPTTQLPSARTASAATPKPPHRRPPGPSSFAEIELDTPHGQPNADSQSLVTMAYDGTRRPHRLLRATLTTAALIAAAIVAVWFLQPSAPGPIVLDSPKSSVVKTTASAGASPIRAPATPAVATPTASTPSGVAPGGRTPAASTPAGGAAPPTASTSAVAPLQEAAPPPPPPPPPPKKAALWFDAAWNPAIRVRVGEQALILDRQRKLELPAGSYKLKFELDQPDYSAKQETTVKLEAGGERRIANPIAKPGRLTVQPHLNTRQGFVRVDGQLLGATPLRGRWFAPGEHHLEVLTGADPGSTVGFQDVVGIKSEVETVVTFDVDGKIAPRISERPAPPP